MPEKFRGRVRHLTQIGALITLIGIGGYATGALLDQFVFNPPGATAAGERPCEYNTCMSECEWVEVGVHLRCGPNEICYLSEGRGNCRMTAGGGCEVTACKKWWQLW